MNEKTFHEIVSGRRRGPLASIARGLLWLAQGPYAVAVATRNRRFDRKRDAVTRVEVPVISVGNLTVGGTGKTPMVKWIATQLREHGVRVAILSRGYGAEEGAKNDEAIELEQALPDVPHLQAPDRVASARVAIDELASQVLLLDDGFQHRRLGRDLDIVLLDATEPFGHGHLLPRGLLREPIASLARADVVCLTRANMASAKSRANFRQQVSEHATEAIWCEASHQPKRLLSTTGQEQPIASLAGKRVAAFCGIGNPDAFHRTLESLGIEIAAWRVFPDHHPYQRGDIAQLESDAKDVDLVLCTHKDLAKVQTARLGKTPLWAIEVEIQLTVGEESLKARLEEIAQLALREESASDGLPPQ